MQTTLQDIVSRLDVLISASVSAKNILTIEEAAAFTGLSVSTIYKLTSRQEIPHYKPRGKMLCFNRIELEAWQMQNRVKTTDEIQTEAGNHVAKGGR